MTGSLILSASLASESATDPVVAARIADLAEAASLDMLVLGDGALPPRFDPLVVAGWLAPRLPTVGVVPLLRTRHAEPFHVARALSALDFLTDGRSGWLPHSGAGHGRDQATDGPRTVDFVAATRSLWDSWDADALIIDQASGVYLEPTRVRRSNHQGTHFRVLGPLNAARPPQGHPILVRDVQDPALHLSPGLADVVLVDVLELQTLGADAARRLAKVTPAQLREPALAIYAALFKNGAIDGIHIRLDEAETELPDFIRAVLPAFSAGGLLRQGPATGSLRARFGLPVPGAPLHD